LAPPNQNFWLRPWPPWDTALVSDIISHVACESPPIPSYISKAAEDFLRGWLLFEESTGENDS